MKSTSSKYKYEHVVGLLAFAFGCAILIFNNNNFINFLNFIYAAYMIASIVLITARKTWSQPDIIVKCYAVLCILALASAPFVIVGEVEQARLITLITTCGFIYISLELGKVYPAHIYLIHGLALGVFINFLIGLGLYDPGLEIMEGWRFQGLTLKSNILAYYCIVSIFGILYLLRSHDGLLIRLYAVSVIGMNLYIIMLTASRKGMLGAAILVGLYLIMSKWSPSKIIKMTIPIIALFLAYNQISHHINTTSSHMNYERLFSNIEKRIDSMTYTITSEESGVGAGDEERLDLIDQAIDMWADSPLFGAGVDAFQAKYGKYAHNNYVDLLANYGITGFISYYTIYLILILRLMQNSISRQSKVLVLSGLITSLLVEVAMVNYANKIALLFFALMAIILKEEKRSYAAANFYHKG